MVAVVMVAVAAVVVVVVMAVVVVCWPRLGQSAAVARRLVAMPIARSAIWLDLAAWLDSAITAWWV